MFSSRKITTFIKSYLDRIKHFHELLQKADAVIIGAGSGMSTPAGFT